MKRGIIVTNKRWYFHLLNSETNKTVALLDEYPLSSLAGHLVVCYTPPRLSGFSTDRPLHLFGYFDFYAEFYLYHQKTSEDHRCFYEVIFGEFFQKPHFDIDIDRDDVQRLYPGEEMMVVGTQLLEATILACIQVLDSSGVKVTLEKNFLIYSSHGPNKCSYHLIITGCCHSNNLEAKAFYHLVCSELRQTLDNKYLSFLDASVYSQKQQMRILGCCKVNTERKKFFLETYQGKKITFTHQYPEPVNTLTEKKLVALYESLVSFVSGCTLLPSFLPPEENRPSFGSRNLLDLNIADGEACLEILRDNFAERKITCPFSVRKVEGGLIVLRRHHQSWCPSCQKIHHHENPFLHLIGSQVYWDCRRRSNGEDKLLVGEYHLPPEEAMIGKVEDEGKIAVNYHNVPLPSFPSHGVCKEDDKKPLVNHHNVPLPSFSSLQALQEVKIPSNYGKKPSFTECDWDRQVTHPANSEFSSSFHC